MIDQPDLLAVVAAMPQSSAVLAADPPRFTALAVSDALVAAAGRPRAALVGRPIAEAIPDPGADDPAASGVPALLASLEAAVRTGETQRLAAQRYDVRRADGTWETRYWDAVNTPVRGVDGAVRWVLHQSEDVTARARGEAAAVRAERRAARLLAQIGDAHATLDADFRITSLNPAAERALGVPAGALLGRSHWEAFPASAGTEVERQYRRVARDRTEAHFTFHYVGEGYDVHLETDAYPTDDGGVAVFWRDATERVRAEAALRASEARYRTLFESLDAGFFILQLEEDAGRAPDLRCVEANRAFTRQTGIEGVVGRTLREVLPNAEPFWVDAYAAVARTGEPARLVGHSAATGRWYDAYAFRVDRPEDRRVAVLFTDVTAAKEAERERERLLAALEVERARLAAVFAQTPSVLAIVRGPRHVLELANDAYLALNGRRDVLGKPLLDAVPELRGQGFDRLLDAVVATGEPFVGREVPIRLSTSAGAPPEERFFDFVYLPLVEPDAAGTPTRVGVIAHGNDITEQVRARREVERARERADRLQALTAALAAATTPEEVAEVVVAQGVAATGAATGMLVLRVGGGGRVEEGVSLRQHGLPAPVASAYARFALTAPGPAAECLRTGAAILLPTREAVLSRYADMPEVWESLGTHALATVPLDVAGETVGAMSFTFTAPREFPGEAREFFLALGRQAAQALERARLFAAERAARADAEAANRAKGEFLAVMSHELRTPLNAIGGYAELMELGIHGPVTAEQRNALARIQRSQRHLLGLINEVLNYARLESGAVTYDLRPTTVAEALHAVAPLVEPQRAAKGLALDLRLDAGGAAPRVIADPEKLQQVLLNLLGNAVKFTGAGGRIAVTLEDVPARGLAVLRVRDTGVGIPAEKLEAIFEPFVQVRAGLTRPHEGTGLGLAISRDLARGMGGDLRAESVEGEGSTFVLELRRAPDAAAA